MIVCIFVISSTGYGSYVASNVVVVKSSALVREAYTKFTKLPSSVQIVESSLKARLYLASAELEQRLVF